LADLQHYGYFKDKSLVRPRCGPDANTTVILARSGDIELKMQSWHELYESGGKVLATDQGLGALGDHDRGELLRKAGPDYLFYRLAWNELRLAAASLIPAESKPITGNFKLRNGQALWIED